MKIKKKQTVLLIVFIVLILWIAWIIFENSHLEINKFNVKSHKIPQEFDGFRIAQILDLHNTEFGENNEKLISLLKQADADIIAITGDLIDSRKTNIDAATEFAREAVHIAPTYYVTGNHEARITGYDKLKQELINCGVIVLENEAVNLKAEGKEICVIGLTDPSFSLKYVDDTMEQNISKQLSGIVPNNDNYKVLLAHRPEYFSIYAKKVDLALCGHAHGGQFILPLIGGFVAPGQGLFPKYYKGIYTEANSNMIVSRGIGNSIIPFRFNNKPEIVVAELTCIAN